MLFNPLVLEFFALARGYSMAWTFFLWASLMLLNLIKHHKIKYFHWLLIFTILCLYANLSMIIATTLIVTYACFFVLLRLESPKKISFGLGLVAWMLPFAYFVNYSLDLQKMGKLYLGDSENFFTTTIENLIELSFNLNGVWTQVISFSVVVLIVIQLLNQLMKRAPIFNLSYVFQQLFILAVFGVLALQQLMRVNYPENRAAVYLYLLAIPAFSFALDQIKAKHISRILTILLLIVFVKQYNLKYTKTYAHEYINFEILQHIPTTVKGIPTACGGRHLAVCKVIYRESDEPNMHYFQTALSDADTLQDYLMCLEEDRKNITDYYNLVAKTEDSKMRLYKRKEFLERIYTEGWSYQIDSKDEFINLMPRQTSKAAFIRCKGFFEAGINQDVSLIYAQSDRLDNKYNYGSFTPISSIKKSKDGRFYFDITVTMLELEKAQFMSFYLWNRRQIPIKGEIEVSLYDIKF